MTHEGPAPPGPDPGAPGFRRTPSFQNGPTMPNVVPIFPTALLVSDRYLLDEAERALLTGQSWGPNRSGNQTSVDTYVLQDPRLAGLRDFLFAQLQHYAREVMCLPKGLRSVMTQSWVNRNEPGSSHHAHSHPNSLVSGVFFIAGDACPLVFHRDPVAGTSLSFQPTTVHAHNAQRWDVRNEPGIAVLFPSTLRHEVVDNDTSTTRYSLSFNSFVSGRIGSRRKLTELVL